MRIHMLLNRLCIIMSLFIVHTPSLFAMEKVEETQLCSEKSSLTIRCYEYCGIYTDVPMNKESATWVDFREALQVHQNNFTEPLHIEINNNEIQDLQAFIPEKYYNGKKTVYPVIFYAFGDPDAAFREMMYGDRIDDTDNFSITHPKRTSLWKTTKGKCRRFFREMVEAVF